MEYLFKFKNYSSVKYFPVLHILQVHENRTFQLSSSTEKWSEVFLSESIFLSDELSLQHRSPYQRDSDTGLSLVIEPGWRSDPSCEQAGRESPLKARSPPAGGSQHQLWGQHSLQERGVNHQDPHISVRAAEGAGGLRYTEQVLCAGDPRLLLPSWLVVIMIDYPLVLVITTIGYHQYQLSSLLFIIMISYSHNWLL